MKYQSQNGLDKTTVMETKQDDAGYTTILITDRISKTEIKFRNCSEVNHDCALQFEITKTKFGLKRNAEQFFSFSIPACMVDDFIKNLSQPYK